MKNIRITNMNNNTCIILSKENFNNYRTILSENSVYEETNDPVTMITISEGE